MKTKMQNCLCFGKTILNISEIGNTNVLFLICFTKESVNALPWESKFEIIFLIF